MCGGETRKQRPPMWLKLNIYHVQGQWVTYSWEYSSIRLKIYYPQPPVSPHFFFSVCLGRCEAGAGLSVSLFLFHSAVGVESFVLKCHVFLILRPFGWKFLKTPGSAFVAGWMLGLCCDWESKWSEAGQEAPAPQVSSLVKHSWMLCVHIPSAVLKAQSRIT